MIAHPTQLDVAAHRAHVARQADTLPPDSEPCLWQSDVCLTRARLRRAVVETSEAAHTKHLPVATRTAAINLYHAALRALEAHSCDDITAGGGLSVDETAEAPGGAVTAPPAGRTSRIALDRLHQECVDAGVQWGIRFAGGANTDEAMARMKRAHAAFHDALDRYHPGRRDISFYLDDRI